MNTETLQFEIVPANLEIEPAARQSLEVAFSGFFEQARAWQENAATITEPKLARTARLELKNIRVAAEKKRKELKEESLRMGKAIDGANNILLAYIVPIEKSLEEIEKQEERRIAAEKAALLEERTDAIRPYADPSVPLPDLGAMTPEQFQRCLSDAKILHQAKLEAAARVEAERIAREKKEAEEREAQRIENIRLKAEAEAREKAMQAERAAAEKALAEERRIAAEKAAAAEKLRQDAEAKARKEREAAEAKAKAERDAAEAKAKVEREAAEEVARKERLRLQAIAETERQKAQAAEKAAAKAKARLEAEAQALREAEAKRIAAEKAAAEAKAKAEATAAKKAAAAPDKAKLIGFAGEIAALRLPEMKSDDGKRVAAEVEEKILSFAKWIQNQADKL